MHFSSLLSGTARLGIAAVAAFAVFAPITAVHAQTTLAEYNVTLDVK